MPYLPQQRVLLPGVQSSDLTTGSVKSGRGKDALVQGGMDSIATVKVPSGGLANISFQGIPQGYQHLQLRITAKSTGASGPYNFKMFFNEASSVIPNQATNYALHNMTGQGSSTPVIDSVTGGSRFIEVGYIAAADISNVYTSSIVDILDYADTTKYKTTRGIAGYDANGSGRIQIISGMFMSLDAITSIVMYPSTGSFAQDSHFALYGVR